MRYEGKIYRPPSEAYSYILQATVGCSWNHCTYCDMYREKTFRVRELDEILQDIDDASTLEGASGVEKVFVADGDALVMPMDHWLPILERLRERFGALRQVSAYAMARNIVDKGSAGLARLREAGLGMLYIGPESGDDETLKRIAKGDDFAAHVEAAGLAHAAGMKLSVITLLGAGGIERSQAHAEATARLITEMNPAFAAALTLTVVPGTPLAKLAERGRFTLPSVERMLEELRVIVANTSPTDTVFRTNHASNYLPIGGHLPQDRAQILEVIDAALSGLVPLRPEWSRGL